jgi:hypothetical protein
MIGWWFVGAGIVGWTVTWAFVGIARRRVAPSNGASLPRRPTGRVVQAELGWWPNAPASATTWVGGANIPGSLASTTLRRLDVTVEVAAGELGDRATVEGAALLVRQAALQDLLGPRWVEIDQSRPEVVDRRAVLRSEDR